MQSQAQAPTSERKIDPARVIDRMMTRLHEMESARTSIRSRIAPLQDQLRETEEEIMRLRDMLGLGPDPEVLARPALPAKAGVSGRTRTPKEIVLRRVAMAKGLLRGGITMPVLELHRHIVREMGEEDAGSAMSLSGTLRYYDEVFESDGRGAFKLTAKAQRQDD